MFMSRSSSQFLCSRGSLRKFCLKEGRVAHPIIKKLKVRLRVRSPHL
ncbi:Hypothetical protein Cp262_0689 [Corynebacterium pseudotuberculosis]|nr:Hypothetical protein Cp262_0689 [Corynebacterium pseudotuberculosis]